MDKHFASESVLVVDDDAFVLEALSQQLEAIGVGCIHRSQSAPDALNILRKGAQITSLLSDIAMPGMDGPLFLRELAAIGFRGRIILVSGVSNDLMHSIGELGRSHSLNVTGFIHKPVTQAALKALLVGAGQKERGGIAATPDTPGIDAERLRLALGAGEIVPFYQPKTDAQSLRVVGVEALARWRLPDGKLVSPGLFVPAIEAAGLSVELFEAMVTQVMRDLATWRTAGISIKAAVNLSMDCALNLDLPDRLQQLLSEYSVSARQLVIEVTETRLMSNRAAAMETLTRLSLMGLTLSIDDFGTGYSGLAQLADLPFGELKVDGGFVRRAGRDSKADAILETTVTFGRSLGMTVVAEGVETHDQLDILRKLGASQLQGFLVARPMPAASFVTWLAAWRPGSENHPGCARPFTLAVVDDSASMRAVVEAELCERLGAIEILSADSADAAERLFDTHQIDATTLDFHMPGRNGLELLRVLRNRSPATVHVLLTSDLAEDIARAATALGAMYCTKPLTRAQADRIAQYLRTKCL